MIWHRSICLGTCGVLTFGIKGGRDASIKFMDNLKFVAIVTHVADAVHVCYILQVTLIDR